MAAFEKLDQRNDEAVQPDSDLEMGCPGHSRAPGRGMGPALLPLPSLGLSKQPVGTCPSAAARPACLRQRWTGSRRQGGEPFYPSIWFPIVVGVGLPLGALPLSNAANLWLLISLGAALGTVLLVYRSLIPCRQPHSVLRAGLLVMLFVPPYAHLNQGQVSLLVLASAVAGWALLEQGHPGWAGAVLSLGWAKPQLVILIWPALAWLAAKQGKTRLLCLGWLAGSLGQTLPLWILDPIWPAGYLEALRANPNWLQPNIRSLLAFWSNNEAVGWLVALLALGIGVAWLSRLWRRGSGIVALAWTLALTPTLSPFSWSYDQVLLLPLLAITLVPARPGARRTVAWVIFFACQVVYLALRENQLRCGVCLVPTGLAGAQPLAGAAVSRQGHAAYQPALKGKAESSPGRVISPPPPGDSVEVQFAPLSDRGYNGQYLGRGRCKPWTVMRSSSPPTTNERTSACW
jgi:hypothetical protein